MEAPRLFNTQTSDIFRSYEVRKRQVQGTQKSYYFIHKQQNI